MSNSCSACGNPNAVPAKASPSSIVSIVSSGVSTSHNSSSATANRTAGTVANHVSSSPASSSKDSGLVDVASNCSSSSASAINNRYVCSVLNMDRHKYKIMLKCFWHQENYPLRILMKTRAHFEIYLCVYP